MRELGAAVTDAAKPPKSEGVEELLTLLDKELNLLPEKYRVAVILCELQGISRKDAARVLGWPEGTLSSRLSRARAMLAKGMAINGAAFSSVFVTSALSKSAASAAVQPLVAAPLMKAAALVAAGKSPTGVFSTRVIALSEGMVKAMFISRFQLVTVVFLL